MHLVLLCATRRGCHFLQKVTELLPNADLTVFSFQEESWEPPFLQDIREYSLSKGFQFFETRQVEKKSFSQFWESSTIDLMFVASWRYLIPKRIYSRSRLGTFVFHDSLLPEYRGFSPTVWAIMHGQDHTGVTLFEITEGTDAGDIVDQKVVPIGPDEPIAAVIENVTQTYLALLERNLEALSKGTAPRRPQNHQSATYTCRLFPEDHRIDWTASSAAIYNLIRAVGVPYPGAYTQLGGQEMRVWEAKRVSSGRKYIGRIAGKVVEVLPGEGSIVLTGDGSILLTQVQMKGSEIVCAADLLRRVGQTLGR